MKAQKLASIGAREYAQAGGLIGYGGNLPSLYRRAAYFVDKILKGAKPADLPVEQPTRFELVMNLKTAKTLGVKYVMTAWIPHQGPFTAEHARKAAADFNKWGAAFRAEGITYGYHPHGFEFVSLPAEGGKTPFDIIAAETNPEFVSFEMDVFWVFHAGIDPTALLKKYPTRWSLLHVKDIRKGAVTGLSTGGAAPIDNVAVGTGQINWPSVLKTAEQIGVKHFFIEDETPSPLVCIPDSLK